MKVLERERGNWGSTLTPAPVRLWKAG